MIKAAHHLDLSDSISRKRPLSLTLIMACAVAMAGAILSVPFGRSIFAEPPPQDSFEKYVESNDRFGTKLFRDLLAEGPDKNLVFSPLGISSLFACLREGMKGTVRNELDKAFEWAPGQELGPPHKRLTARFLIYPFPSPEEKITTEDKKRLEERLYTGDQQIRSVSEGINLPKETSRREELWLKNSLKFHGSAVQKAFSERFIEKAKNEFGLEFDEVTDAKEWDAAISRFPVVRPMLDLGASEQNILVLTSVVNLRTEWRGGQFGHSGPTSGDFLTADGSHVPVTMLFSDPGIFLYAKTRSYEAVALPAKNADFVVVMPNEGVSLKTLAEAFVEDPDFLVQQLERRPGDVELPEFNFVRKEDFRAHLENMGAKTVFNDLGDLVKIPESKLVAVEQIVSLIVNLKGIKADAWTDVVVVLGGRIENDKGFHMKINRPFLFQIRDNKTGVLLFMGAVTDPSRY